MNHSGKFPSAIRRLWSIKEQKHTVFPQLSKPSIILRLSFLGVVIIFGLFLAARQVHASQCLYLGTNGLVVV